MNALFADPTPWMSLAADVATSSRPVARLLGEVRRDGGARAPAVDLAALLVARRPAAVRPLVDGLPDTERASGVGRLMDVALEARGGALLVAVEQAGDLIHRLRLAADERLLVWALQEGGRAAGIHGATARCLSWLEEGIEVAQRLPVPLAEGLLQTSLGMLHGQAGRSERYAHHTRLALALAREADDPQGVALALCNLGGASTSLGHREAAQAAYDEALQLARSVGLERIEALVHAGLGGLAFAEGRVEQGLAAYERSERVLETLGDAYQITRQVMLTAQALQRAGRLAEAAARFERGVYRAREAGARHVEAAGLRDLAECHLALGDAAAAHEAFRACIRCQHTHLDARVEAVRAEAARAQATLLASKRATWERERRLEVEASHAALEEALEQQAALRAELERQARSDVLTGLPNRRAFDERLDEAWRGAHRYGRALALVFFDIDHFKRVNDRHGHDTGDEVLIEVARRASAGLRAADGLARWGGEEFVAMLPETAAQGAAVWAERLLGRLREVAVATTAGPVAVTASAGVAAMAPGAPLTARQLLQRADEALYEAKRRGRDRVVVAS